MLLGQFHSVSHHNDMGGEGEINREHHLQSSCTMILAPRLVWFAWTWNLKALNCQSQNESVDNGYYIGMGAAF